MAHRVLVVATADVPAAEVRSRVGAHAGEEAEVRVVVPASNLSVLDWLTNDEDDVRAEAGQRAEAIAAALPGEGIETEVGDTDPVTAIEDALRTFPADELVVVTRPDEQASWLEQGAGRVALECFALPVTHLVVEG